MMNSKKTDMRLTIGLMILVVILSYVFLWANTKTTEERLEQLDPESYDMAITCTEKNGNYLISNDGNDKMFIYNDVEVYLKRIDTVIKENGQEIGSVSYFVASIDELEKELNTYGSVDLLLWLTEQGKIETIMIVERFYTSYDMVYHDTNLDQLLDKGLYLLKTVFYDKIFVGKN